MTTSATNTTRSTPMPARIRRGLSRNGRRAAGRSGPEPLARFGAIDVTVAGIGLVARRRRSARSFLDVEQILELAHEFAQVAEVPVDGGKLHVRHLVELLE